MISKPDKDLTTLFSKDAWRFFIQFYDGLRMRLAATTLGSAAQVLLIVPAILLVKYAFDEAIPQARTMQLVYIGIAILVLRVLNSAVSVWLRDLNIEIINTAIFRLRAYLLRRLYELPRSFHTSEDPRIMHARIVQDTERLTQLSNALISRIFPSAIISLALCIVLAVLNWYLLLAMLLLAPLILLSNRIMGKKIKKHVFVFQRAFEKFSQGMLFVLRYMDLTAIQSAKRTESERQQEVFKELKVKTGKMAFIYALNTQIQEILTGLSGIIIIILGGASVATGWMTLGDFIAFYLGASFLNRHVNFITASFPDVLAGNESMQTLQELAAVEENQPYQGGNEHAFENKIVLHDVHFSYGNTLVLHGAGLEIHRKRRLAVVGANGAGKTTLIHLILGFYKPDKGFLEADSIPYDEIDMEFYRRSIGVVMQNPLIFSGSIRENILYGNPGASQDSLDGACSTAGVDGLVSKFRDGYETQVGEDGVRLSGGERQRIAIARALVRKPSLLILDEPTNHLDNELIASLMQKLGQLDYQPAILLISHDRQVVSFADEVYVIEEGSIKQENKN